MIKVGDIIRRANVSWKRNKGQVQNVASEVGNLIADSSPETLRIGSQKIIDLLKARARGEFNISQHKFIETVLKPAFFNFFF